MPFNISDTKNYVVDNVNNSNLLKKIFTNPFIISAIIIALLFIIYFVSPCDSKKSMFKTGLYMYIVLISCFCLNNSLLLKCSQNNNFTIFQDIDKKPDKPAIISTSVDKTNYNDIENLSVDDILK